MRTPEPVLLWAPRSLSRGAHSTKKTLLIQVKHYEKLWCHETQVSTSATPFERNSTSSTLLFWKTLGFRTAPLTILTIILILSLLGFQSLKFKF